MFCSVVLLALFATVQGRAVNISNTWVLPEEGFPVFYRYFRDRISWYEADAVCQFHHANLVTVDTTAQYDAVRAYLKELDISSAVWVGLIRSNPDGDFTWTDYRGLSGDGYWSSAPDSRSAPLCAAADPAADYRWEARACGGPMVASFICELPVPQWALGNEGCMVRALPALTALYLPESAAVQLTADCGMAGVKKVQCTGNVKREDLLKELSCNEEIESTSASSVTASEMTWPVTTEISTSDEILTDQDVTTEINTEDSLSTKHKETTSEPSTTYKPLPSVNHAELLNKARVMSKPIEYKLSQILHDKDINFLSNNLQSNDIPQIAGNDNFLFDEQNEKLEDEKNLKHKMIHDELARLGNFETIFSQPADHFVPPLVMAKSKLSDDMTVMSLKEKHAQQLSEQKIANYNMLNKQHQSSNFEIEQKNISTAPSLNLKYSTDLPVVMAMQAIQPKDYIKKETLKSILPKKYGEKYYDLKSKTPKQFDKVAKSDKIATDTLQTSTQNNIMQTTTPISFENISDVQSDLAMDLTVILKEPSLENLKPTISEIKTNTTNSTDNVPITTHPDTEQASTVNTFVPEKTESVTKIDFVTETQTTTFNDQTTTDEVIMITILNDNVHAHGSSSVSPPRVIEITTRLPVQPESGNTHVPEMLTTSQSIEITHAASASDKKESLVSSTLSSAESNSLDVKHTNVITTNLPAVVTEEKITIQELDIANATNIEVTTQKPFFSNVVSVKTSDTSTMLPKDLSITTTNIPFTETAVSNSTILSEQNVNTDSKDSIDYLNSPLLSAANEPLHRPNRSRRPQPPNRLSKFNPFRILG